MAKREFMQLGQPLSRAKDSIAGKFSSEKLDGMRFFWDGGVTRGLPIETIPWANIEKSNQVPQATGLWSRYAKVINAPDWWLDKMPLFPIEGELWLGFGMFQKLSSIVRSTVNVDSFAWREVIAKVLDTPNILTMLADGEIKTTNYKKVLIGCIDFFLKRGGFIDYGRTSAFITRYRKLESLIAPSENLQLHEQEQLPFSTGRAFERIEERLLQVLDHGGEGMIVKSGNALWLPERGRSVLKYKPFKDMEATVVGYTWGRETDKGSKLLGLMGSLLCQIPAGLFGLSGFREDERVMVFADGSSAKGFGENHPEEKVPLGIHNPLFPIGSSVTIKYRELTDGGLPKEARYWRKAE